MKTKNIILVLLIGGVLLFCLNFSLLKLYDSYIYSSFNKVMATIRSYYPEGEIEAIHDLVNEEEGIDVLGEYGITLDTIREIDSYQSFRNKIVLGVTITFVLLGGLFFFLYYGFKKKVKNEIEIINLYLNDILNGNYEIHIGSYQEDLISILKNDIYKITVKLKEQTDMAINEKNNLEMILSDISHQIKTPLTSMYVINDLLKSDKLSKKEKIEFLNKNESQLERIEWLVTSLLKLSRLDNGFVKLKKEKVEVAKLIDNCLNPLLIPIELKNQNVVKQIDNFEIDIDFNWFSEAIINILKNAHEHTNAFGTIKVEASDNSMYSSIIISDNGTGISKQDLPHIFERFYKGDNQKESIGIGLNMAKKIIDLSGGEINVLSTPSVGTTFIIKIYKNII